MIDIEAKSTLALLVEEVGYVVPNLVNLANLFPGSAGLASILHIPDRQHHPLVYRRLLLLRILHCFDIGYQYRQHFN